MTGPTLHNTVVVVTPGELTSLIDKAVARSFEQAVADVIAHQAPDAAWLTTRQAARAYGRSRSTLYRWGRAGLVKTKKIGGTRYYAPPSQLGDI